MTVPITPLKQDECAPLEDAGLGALRTDRGNLPLESVDIAADLAGLVAGVTVTQDFRNPYDVPLEATYIFPLPARAAVTAFRMEADDRVIEGLLKERAQARADYDEAVAEGRRAAIAEEDRPDVFTIRVGNIVPGERVRIRLTLSQPLPYEDGAATFRFPLVVAPRYIPGSPLDDAPAGSGTAPDTDAVPDASRITPPVLLPGFPDPVRLSLAVNVDPAGLDLRELRSSLHVVETGEHGVRLQPGERLDRDFILRLRFAASSSLVLAPDDGEGQAGTFALTVVEPVGDAVSAPPPRDVVLVLDRSGSMGGWKMVAARRAAARIVDTLDARDRFAVLSFDTVVERPEGLPSGLVEATDRHRYRAVEHLARVEARGGTKLLQPLREAQGLLADETRERVLVLVTDGQVGNEDQILGELTAGLTGVRVHTVGIDRAVNAGFLGRLASLGGGRCELVESEDRLDEAMEHIHRRIAAPLATDLAVEATDLELLPDTVTRPGSLFPGVPLTVRGRYRAAGPKAALAVRGLDAAGEPWLRTVGASTAKSPAVRAIWARAHVRALEDAYAAGDRSLEQRIVDTSLRYGVLCRFTAFVAADSRVVAEGGPGHQVVQPVELPSGWEMPAPSAPGYGAAQAGMPRSAPAHLNRRLMAARPQRASFAAPASADSAPPASPAAPGARESQLTSGPAGPGAAAVYVRALLQEELARLHAIADRPAAERRRHLTDLGSRLGGLAANLPELLPVAHELLRAEAPDTDLDALWHRVIELLTELTGGRDKPAAPRRSFWKRS
ncbi:VWA domain-containing protein [Streptomyces sp. A7024]|uniref:VWA domain-containing protein n=1 Tax=Streptomyces coryli TaxID=1128680 RepID=A0A6G4U5S5_9ACTN|nr:VIT domain-containing protein [Streptomyces coryli]NGN66647.1 VWA domain-containing protein [Streptomyces coryli]